MPPYLLKHALDQAAVWHREQSRKYPGVTVPYVSHCAGVAAILSRHGFAEEVVAAGALHDVVEDCGVSVEEVGRLASEEDKSLSWEERKRAYVALFPHKPWEAQAITLADKIDNFQSIIVCNALHGNPWALFRRGKEQQLERFGALLEAARTIPPHPLIDEFARTLDEVRAVPEAPAS